jgi:hypothetical protein
MRRALFIAGLVVATLLLAGLGVVISLFRSITSPNFEGSTAQ